MHKRQGLHFAVSGPVSPWRSDNRFTLLNDSVWFFPYMLLAIGAAQWSIELELYLAEDGHCAELFLVALLDARRRGVTVRCSFDGFGCLGLGNTWIQRLREADGELRLYNPLHWKLTGGNLYHDHRKLLLVSGRLGYIGGAGITDEFWEPVSSVSTWCEVMVEMDDPAVADWAALLEWQWLTCLEEKVWKPREGMTPTRPPPQPEAARGPGRMAYADARQHRDILQSLIRVLNGSRRRIWPVTPYFLPTWKVRRALRKAIQRGVEVCLLLAGRFTDHAPVRYAGQRYYPRLLCASVRIHEYQPRLLYLKMIMVDDWASVGSCNFDHWNLRFNLDASLEAFDPDSTNEAAASLPVDFADGREVILAMWRMRPLWMRLHQRLWGWLDRVVVNFLDCRRWGAAACSCRPAR